MRPNCPISMRFGALLEISRKTQLPHKNGHEDGAEDLTIGAVQRKLRGCVALIDETPLETVAGGPCVRLVDFTAPHLGNKTHQVDEFDDNATHME